MWELKRKQGVAPYDSTDPDTSRIWWTDAGVHQNITFPVHPDPVSGQHCWHQAVRVRRAEPGDAYGDVSVDTDKTRRIYKEWMQKARDARRHSPDGTRRPYWLLRPLKPAKEAYRMPEGRSGRADGDGRDGQAEQPVVSAKLPDGRCASPVRLVRPRPSLSTCGHIPPWLDGGTMPLSRKYVTMLP